MPLYEYECGKCSHRFEKIRKFSDPPIDVCPKCGGTVHKLMSSPAIQFKGSGWYITDYARKDSTSAGKAEKSDTAAPAAESKSDTKSDGKAESKPDAKAEKKADSSSSKS